MYNQGERPSGARGKSFAQRIKQHGPQTILRKIVRIVIDTMYDANNGGVHILEKHPQTFGLVLTYYCLYAIAVAIIIAVLTAQGQAQVYLSPYASNSAQNCQEVAKVMTGSFQGDAYGIWETNSAFTQKASVFMLKFQGSSITTLQYQTSMTKFKDRLFQLSKKSALRDAGWNTIAWGTFSFRDPETQMVFYSSADAGTVFNGVTQVGFLTSARGGVCDNNYQIGYYDVSTSTYKFAVPTEKVNSSLLGGFSIPNPQGLPVYPSVDYVYDAPWKDACPFAYPSYNWSSFEPSAQVCAFTIQSTLAS